MNNHVHCPGCGRDMNVLRHKAGREWPPALDILIMQWDVAGLKAPVIARMVDASAQAVRSRLMWLRKVAREAPR